MRNIVLIKRSMGGTATPLSEALLVATFTLAAAATNTQPARISDGKGEEIDVPPGVQYRFERVNLADLFVRGKENEVVYVVGHTA